MQDPAGNEQSANAPTPRRVVGSVARARVTRTLGWLSLMIGLLLASLPLMNSAAQAQTGPIVSVADVSVPDANGTFAVTLSVSTGATALTAVNVALSYDPALVQPVLNTSVLDGIVGAPRCTQLAGGAGACGPVNPTDTILVSTFRFPGGWQGDIDLVEIEFVAQGSDGVTPIGVEINDLVDTNTASIPGVAQDGTVTIGEGTTEPTVTPIPQTADLSVTKNAAVINELQPGSGFRYLVIGTNNSSEAATDVVVTDTLSENLSFDTTPTAVGWSCETVDKTFTCTKASVARGETFVFEYDVVIDSDAVGPGEVSNEVTVSGSSTDPDLSNNSATSAVNFAAAPATPTPDPTGPTSTATPTPDATGPTSTATPTPDATGPTSTATPTPDVAAPTTTPTPLAATATPTPIAVEPTPTPQMQPTQPPLPTAEPALAYPGPFNNAPPSGAIGDGWLIQPNESSSGTDSATAGQPATSTSSSGATTTAGTTTLAVTGDEASVLTTISFALMALGGLLLVTSRRGQRSK